MNGKYFVVLLYDLLYCTQPTILVHSWLLKRTNFGFLEVPWIVSRNLNMTSKSTWVTLEYRVELLLFGRYVLVDQVQLNVNNADRHLRPVLLSNMF